MKDVSNKFYKYLLNKENNFLKKEEIERYFNEFSKLWNIDIHFENVFQSLKQQKKVVFLFNKIWCVLDENKWFKYKNLDLKKLDILIEYFNKNNIEWYFGLSTAKHFLGDWQLMRGVYIINDSFERVLKFDNEQINLVKFPKNYFIEKSIITKNSFRYSDYEKTFLDEIYCYLKKNYNFPKFNSKNIHFNTLNLYLRVFDDDIRTWILNNIDREFVKYIQ